jgi:hypothetical protein
MGRFLAGEDGTQNMQPGTVDANQINLLVRDLISMGPQTGDVKKELAKHELELVLEGQSERCVFQRLQAISPETTCWGFGVTCR